MLYSHLILLQFSNFFKKQISIETYAEKDNDNNNNLKKKKKKGKQSQIKKNILKDADFNENRYIRSNNLKWK